MADGRPSLKDVFFSVLAAMFGVQSEARRNTDFTQGRFRDYVIVGLFLTITFVMMIYGVVQLVLSLAGVE